MLFDPAEQQLDLPARLEEGGDPGGGELGVDQRQFQLGNDLT